MRYSVLLLTVLLSSTSFSQSLIQWGPEITVADGSIYGNTRPRATVVGDDTPVVIFGDEGVIENLFIARWNGTTFDTPTGIVPPGLSSYIADWTGPDIASKGDTVVAIFKLNPLESGHVYAVRSTDGGVTFSDTIRADSHPNGVAWMPSLDIDDNGNPVITYMVHDGVWSNPRYVVAHSTDAGLSYTPEMEVTGNISGEACDCCPAEMVVEGQKQVLLFRNNDANERDMHAVLSQDGGTTFSSFDNVDNLAWTLAACPATGAHSVFYGDTLLTAYASAASGKYRIYLSASNTSADIQYMDRAMVPEPVPSNGTQNYPRISSAGDTLVMAWKESINGNQEVFCSASIPGMDPMVGLTGYKEMANATTAGIQTNPEIIYKNGRVHLFYQEGGSGNLVYRRGTISVTLGLDETMSSPVVFPNPSNNGQFNIPAQVTIHGVQNALGQSQDFVIEEGATHSILTLSSTGIYFANYRQGDHSGVIKLVVR